MDTAVHNIFATLLSADRCIAGVHIVDGQGVSRFSVPAALSDIERAQVSRIGKLLASHAERPCLRSAIDDVMSCIAMQVGSDEVLAVVFFDEPALVARLPRIMARAVAELRELAHRSPPDGGGSGGTPNEARAFVSVRDLDDHDA